MNIDPKSETQNFERVAQKHALDQLDELRIDAENLPKNASDIVMYVCKRIETAFDAGANHGYSALQSKNLQLVKALKQARGMQDYVPIELEGNIKSILKEIDSALEKSKPLNHEQS